MKRKKLNNEKKYMEMVFANELKYEINEKLDKLDMSYKLQVLNTLNYYLYEQCRNNQSLFSCEPSNIDNSYNESFESEASNSCITF
ncbi:hypothetical protein [Clostridium butyricum]|uniref:hypothetical protein n=1 Tax=Clostridium butyricum TaxID=1492 RepID=UPI0018AB15A2|nr:hypothetical protein [Clostridium butyricum]MDB2155854.1 hypothetical protein [Clostridium butyricum]